MWREFKEFAMRGNVVDMAIGIVIGVAFGKVITSLVDNVLMPPIGFVLKNVDFSNLSFILQEKTANSAAVAISYGIFINALINFIIVAFAMFMVVKIMNRLAQKKEEAPTKKECPFCYSNIAIKATRCSECTSQIEP